MQRELLPQFEFSESEIERAVTFDFTRRATFRERFNILSDNLKQCVDDKLRFMFTPESYDDMKHYIDVSSNLMRRVMRELSVVYKDEPDRTVTPQGSQKVYEQIIQGLKLDQKLSRANYLLNGMNDLFIQVANVNGRVDLHILRPDMVTVLQNSDDPTKIDALVIEESWIDEKGEIRKQYIFWSPTRHFILDEGFKTRAIVGNEGLISPYRDINIATGSFYPFVTVHGSDREFEFWDQTTGMDLQEGTKMIAIKNTFLFFMFPMQFKQIALKANFDDGKNVKNNQVKSPLHVFASNAEIQTLDWQSSLQQLTSEIESKVFAIAGNYGISSENFKLTASETSGFARLVAKERMNEMRKEQIKIWRDVEERIFDTVRVVSNLYSLNKPIADNAKISIDYKEPQVLNDPLAELDVLQRKIDMGITNIYDIVKQENPDIKTDEEADAFIQKNISIRNRAKSRFGLGAISPAVLPGSNNPGGFNGGSNNQA